MGTRMTSKETAPYIGASESTLRYWRACDEGPRSYRIGRRTFYDREDVDAWLAAQKEATSRGGAA
ncbi:helix-turn-helix transcriptional regulator [Corynebacterium variabile]|uniref:helix-turn-helix transcriptional regulator n=1 Tax=Corynebacterium variabile TaxID=1727 RepID=UPI003FD2D585